ncbi:Transposase protein [Popillia japonica]|uniref:Transposase protein n=1 Tax=Popillia japonica TaxID=7064 RepID=A0AAW1KQ14_POPJA
MFLNDLKNRLHTHAVPTLFMTSPIHPEKTMQIAEQSHNVGEANIEVDITDDTATQIAHQEMDVCQTQAFVLPDAELTPEAVDDYISEPEAADDVFVPEPGPSHSKADVSLQTGSLLTRNTPRKTKLRRELLKVKRRVLRLQSAPEAIPTKQEFLKQCDLHLSSELAAIVKFNAQYGCKDFSRYSSEYKEFALNVYFLGPKVYTYLGKIFKLPKVRTLRRWTQSWDVCEGTSTFLYEALRLRTVQFKAEARECILCVHEMSLKTNLFYNKGRDEIIGFHKTNGNCMFKPAKFAIVLFLKGLKGIHVNWKQPLGYALTNSTCGGKDLKTMLFSAITKLREIDLNVRVVISDAGSNFLKFAADNGVKAETPYFYVQENKVFYLFDSREIDLNVRVVISDAGSNFLKFAADNGVKAETPYF